MNKQTDFRFVVVENILDDEQALTWVTSFKTLNEAKFAIENFLQTILSVDENKSYFDFVDWKVVANGVVEFNLENANRIYSITKVNI